MVRFYARFSSEGIAYIRDERNAFLPFIGAVISDEVLGASPAAFRFRPNLNESS